MKSFADFLTPNLITELSEIAADSAARILEGTENLPEGQRAAMAATKSSVQVSIELLRRYHEWMNQ